MSIWAGILAALAAVAVMEGVAYAAHRWVMHGFLWSLHKSHHEPREGLFERNDWFAFMFALPSILCIYLGVEAGLHPAFAWVGVGIAMYGAIYFGFHDVIVHRRIRHNYVPKSAYMKRIVQAHRLHHVVGSKHGTVSFGFLWAPPVRKLKAELEARGMGEYRTPAGA